VSDEAPRAFTAEELRDQFMDTCRALADFWADPANSPDHTWPERVQGLLHSFLVILDGGNGGLPAFKVLADPHPDDKQDSISEGENWIEPGTDITEGATLHERLYKRGIWAGR
jgi:hypothetical protein